MTQFDERWEDPINAGIFTPTDDQVNAILEEANRQPISEKTPRRKLVMAAAILAFTIIGCAVAVRSVDTLWGKRVLDQGYSASQNMSAGSVPSEGAATPETMGAEMPQSSALGNAPKPSMAAAAPQAAPSSQEAASGSGASGSSTTSTESENKYDASVALSLQALCANADLVVAGNFDKGVFIVEEELKGEGPLKITIADAQTLRGWAVLFLNVADNTVTFSQEPYLFRLEEGRLVARDASGAPMAQFNNDNAGMTLDTLREICAEENAYGAQ